MDITNCFSGHENEEQYKIGIMYMPEIGVLQIYNQDSKYESRLAYSTRFDLKFKDKLYAGVTINT